MENQENEKVINLAKKIVKQILQKIAKQETLTLENKRRIKETVRSEISNILLVEADRISEKIKEEVNDILKVFDSVYEQVFDEYLDKSIREHEQVKKNTLKAEISMQQKADEFNRRIRVYVDKIDKQRPIEEGKKEIKFTPLINGKFVDNIDKEIGE